MQIWHALSLSYRYHEEKGARIRSRAEFRPSREETKGPIVDGLRRQRGCGTFGAQEKDLSYVSEAPKLGHAIRKTCQ
jgi:hypothetical protein